MVLLERQDQCVEEPNGSSNNGQICPHHFAGTATAKFVAVVVLLASAVPTALKIEVAPAEIEAA